MEQEKAKYEVSLVIVFTDEKKLQEAKLWIERQSVCENVETVLLDNRGNRFSSCTQALNYGAEHSTGDVILFMHQDVYLWDLQAVEKYCAFLKNNPDAVIGVAGIPADMGVVTDLYETLEKHERGIRAKGKEYPVVALDECLLAMKRERWQLLRFDEQCCDNWHGYGMDICYSNTLQGGRNIMVPLQICHDSFGTPHTASYRSTIKNLVRKYRGTPITQIRGTCIQIPCSWRGYYWYVIKTHIKALLRMHR